MNTFKGQSSLCSSSRTSAIFGHFLRIFLFNVKLRGLRNPLAPWTGILWQEKPVWVIKHLQDLGFTVESDSSSRTSSTWIRSTTEQEGHASADTLKVAVMEMWMEMSAGFATTNFNSVLMLKIVVAKPADISRVCVSEALGHGRDVGQGEAPGHHVGLRQPQGDAGVRAHRLKFHNLVSEPVLNDEHRKTVHQIIVM